MVGNVPFFHDEMILVYNTSLNYIKKFILLRGQPATAGFSSTRTIWVSCSAYAEASADTVVTLFAFAPALKTNL